MITKHRKLFNSPLTAGQVENTQKNMKEIDQGRKAMAAYPRRIIAELTNDCNINCIMCGRTNQDFQKSNFDRAWFKKLEKSFQYSEEIVLHGWGEPMIHPEFREIMAYLDQYSIRKYFVTNGTMLRNHMETIFENHLDILAISIDGAKAQTNNRIRRGSNLDQIVESIQMITSYRKEHNLNYPYINFVFTGMKDNIRELPMMIDLAAKVGIEEVKMVYLTAFTPDMMEQSLFNQVELVREVFEETKRRAREKSIKVKLPPIQGEDPQGESPHYLCHFPYRDLFIGSDGYVRSCVSSSERLFSIDDCSEFDDIWNHSELQDVREKINDPQKENEQCRECYHSSTANWNLKRSFIRLSKILPDWGMEDA